MVGSAGTSNAAEKRRPPAVKNPWWARHIKTELDEFQGDPQNGFWDPRQRFSDADDMKQFFSGKKVRPLQKMDREKFARWAIGHALEQYGGDASFKITGQIMKSESLNVGTRGKQAEKKVADTMRAMQQQGIDTEDFNPVIKDEDAEIIQTVGSAAQAVLSASPNSLGPPIRPCASYLQMEKCGEYGRNELTIWKSPLFPTLDNNDGRRGFLDNQVTAIVWILARLLGELPRLKDTDGYFFPETRADRENRQKLRGPKYSGAVLADSMGLGKTLTTIACLDLLVGQGLNVLQDEDGQPSYYPTLILAPNMTVLGQWVDELNQTTSESTICNIVIAGKGVQAPPVQNRIVALEDIEFAKYWPAALSYMWDSNNPNAAKSVIVMSIDTWSSRTCASEKDDDTTRTWYSNFTEHGRRFSLVIVDEAYKVKNPNTRNWRSVALLERQFTLLITATPCMNTLTDLLGPARLLWSTPEAYLKKQRPETWAAIEEQVGKLGDLSMLDNMEPWDDFQLVAGRPSLLAKMVCKDRSKRSHDITLTRQHLKYFETLAILRRSPCSYIYTDWEERNPISLEGLLPNVENYTVDIQMNDALDLEYQEVHTNLFIEYIKMINGWSRVLDRKSQPITTSHRMFQIASASLDVYRLDKLFSANGFGTKTEHVTRMRQKGVNFLRLAQFLLEPTDPEPRVCLDYVKLAVRKSPILRYVLHYIRENILKRTPNEKIKKLLIVEAVPIVALYYELVLQLLGINCRVLHADLSNEDRRQLVADFNSDDPDSCQILIQMYTVQFAGSNLHRNCSRVLVTSQATSLAIQWQAIHRVIRVGQTSDVQVYRLKVNNSYHAFRESRQVEKLLPELGARAHGQQNQILVQLLNLFQFEIDEAWRTPEARQLMSHKKLLSDEVIKKEEEADARMTQQPDQKRIKLEKDGSSARGPGVPVIKETFGISPISGIPSMREAAKVAERKRKQEEAEMDEFYEHFSDSSEDARDDEVVREGEDKEEEEAERDTPHVTDAAFLALRTRDEYYGDFKLLSKDEKAHFSHEKNELRRILSYGSGNHNATTRVWSVQDLEDPAVLERGFELLLRVGLGAKNISMLPFPQVDFSRAPAKLKARLYRLLAHVNHIEQDIDAAQEKKESNPALKETLKVIGVSNSLAKIDDAFSKEALHGESYRKKKKHAVEAEAQEALGHGPHMRGGDRASEGVKDAGVEGKDAEMAADVEEIGDEMEEGEEGEEVDYDDRDADSLGAVNGDEPEAYDSELEEVEARQTVGWPSPSAQIKFERDEAQSGFDDEDGLIFVASRPVQGRPATGLTAKVKQEQID